MSNAVFLTPPKDRKFNPDHVEQVLSRIPGITALKRVESGSAASRYLFLQADYRRGADEVQVALFSETMALSLEGPFDVVLFFALEFSALYIGAFGTSLEIYDERYDFHQELKEGMTPDSLRDAIANDPYAASPQAYFDSVDHGNQTENKR